MQEHDMPDDKEALPIVSEAMLSIGVKRLAEQHFLDDPDEIVSVVYYAMELQRRREERLG